MNITELKRLWKGFWQLADPKIWVASTIPMALGGALSFGKTGKLNLFWFFVSLLAAYLIEIGKNAVNEVIDYRSGVDREVAPDKKTPFSGGKKTIVEGKLSVLEAGMIGALCIGAACLLGIYIMLFREMNIFWIGLAGVLLSMFYSLPPFKFAYRGFGELVVGITFGPLITSGIFLVMTHSLDWTVVAASLPVGFVIANVLWINQYPDYEVDKAGGKKNWVVRLGKKKALNVYIALFAIAFTLFIPLAIIFINPFWLLGLAGLPFAIKAVSTAKVHYDDIQKLIGANGNTVLSYQFMGLGMVFAVLLGKIFGGGNG